MKTRKTPTTYAADFGCKTVRVTVPERHDTAAYSGEAKDILLDALRDNLSPQAVAAIVSYLQPFHTKDSGVNKEVAWFSERLVELLGGYEQQSRLAEELGM